jgi:hypothetical protein
MTKLLTRVLWSRRRRWQFVVAGAGFLLGLLMIMLAVQVFVDIQNALKRGTGSEFMIVSKKVTRKSTLNFLMSGPAVHLDEDDLAGLKRQPFIKDVTPIVSNRFTLYTNLASLLEIEDMFDVVFESVPDKFMDTLPDAFRWKEGDQTIPILVSKDKLDLYNFNAALLYELPQVSQELLMSLSPRIIIAGQGQRVEYKGKIVGFTHRIQTLAVPLNFLLWANAEYGRGSPQTSKAMIEVTDPGDPRLRQYLDSNLLETNLDQLRSDSRYKYVTLVSKLVSIVGLLFTGLSLVIFLLTLQLLISRSQEEVRLLMTLGYTPATLGTNLLRNFTLILAGIAGGTVALYVLCTLVIQEFLLPLGVVHNLNPAAWVVGTATLALTVVVNYVSVRANLRRLAT